MQVRGAKHGVERGDPLDEAEIEMRTAARPPRSGRAYFLWRCRFNSLRCLCLRIFLRRFLMTLPTGLLPLLRTGSSRSERA